MSGNSNLPNSFPHRSFVNLLPQEDRIPQTPNPLSNEKKSRGKSFDKNNLYDVERLLDEIENLNNIIKNKDDIIKSLKTDKSFDTDRKSTFGNESDEVKWIKKFKELEKSTNDRIIFLQKENEELKREIQLSFERTRILNSDPLTTHKKENYQFKYEQLERESKKITHEYDELKKQFIKLESDFQLFTKENTINMTIKQSKHDRELKDIQLKQFEQERSFKSREEAYINEIKELHNMMNNRIDTEHVEKIKKASHDLRMNDVMNDNQQNLEKIQELEQRCLVLEREKEKYAKENQIFLENLKEGQRMNDKYLELSLSFDRLNQDKNELFNENNNKAQMISNLNSEIAVLRENQARNFDKQINDKINEFSQERNDLNRNIQELFNENNHKLQIINNLNAKCKELDENNSTLMERNRKLDDICNGLRKDLDSNNLGNSVIMENQKELDKMNEKYRTLFSNFNDVLQEKNAKDNRIEELVKEDSFNMNKINNLSMELSNMKSENLYLTNENTRIKTMQDNYNKSTDNLRNELNQLKSETLNLKNQNETYKVKIDRLTNELESLTRDFVSKQEEIFKLSESKEMQVTEMHQKNESLISELNKMSEEKKKISFENIILNGTIKEQKESLERLELSTKRLNDEHLERERSIAFMKEQLYKSDNQIKDLSINNNNLNDKLAVLQKENLEFKHYQDNHISTTQFTFGKLEIDLNNMKEENKILTENFKEIKEIQNSYESLKQKNSYLTIELNNLNAERTHLINENATLNEKATYLQNLMEKFKSEIDNLNSNHRFVEDHNVKLSETLENLRKSKVLLENTYSTDNINLKRQNEGYNMKIMDLNEKLKILATELERVGMEIVKKEEEIQMLVEKLQNNEELLYFFKQEKESMACENVALRKENQNFNSEAPKLINKMQSLNECVENLRAEIDRLSFEKANKDEDIRILTLKLASNQPNLQNSFPLAQKEDMESNIVMLNRKIRENQESYLAQLTLKENRVDQLNILLSEKERIITEKENFIFKTMDEMNSSMNLNQEKLLSAENIMSNLQQAMKVTQKENENLKNQLLNLKQNKEFLFIKSKENVDSYNSAQERIANLQSTYNSLHENNKKLEGSYNQLLDVNNKLNNDNETLLSKIESLENDQNHPSDLLCSPNSTSLSAEFEKLKKKYQIMETDYRALSLELKKKELIAKEIDTMHEEKLQIKKTYNFLFEKYQNIQADFDELSKENADLLNHLNLQNDQNLTQNKESQQEKNQSYRKDIKNKSLNFSPKVMFSPESPIFLSGTFDFKKMLQPKKPYKARNFTEFAEKFKDSQDFNENMEDLEAKKLLLETELENCRELLAVKNEEAEQLLQNSQEMIAKLNFSMSKLGETETICNEISKNLQKSLRNAENLEETLQLRTKEISELKISLKGSQEEISRNKGIEVELAGKNNLIASLKAGMARKEEDLEDRKVEIDVLNEKIEFLHQKIELGGDMEEEMAQKNNKIEMLEKSQNAMKMELQSLSSALSQKQRELEGFVDKLKEKTILEVKLHEFEKMLTKANEDFILQRNKLEAINKESMDFQIQNENSSKENIYLKNQLKKLAEELPHKDNIIFQLETNIRTLNLTIEEIKKCDNEKTEQIKRASKNTRDDQITEWKKMNEHLFLEIKELQTKNNELNDHIKENSRHYFDEIKSLENKILEINQQASNVQGLKDSLKKEKEKNMQINQTINSLEVDNEKKNLVLENLEANINFLKKETQSLETQLKEKEKERIVQKNNFANLTEKSRNSKLFEEEISDLNNKIKNLEFQSKNHENDKRSLDSQLDTLKEKVYKLNNENNNLKERLLEIKENNNLLSNQRKEILRENSKNNIQSQNLLREQEIDHFRKKWEEEIKLKLERELGDISLQFNEEKESYQNEINNLNDVIVMKEQEVDRLEIENENITNQLKEIVLKLQESTTIKDSQIDQIKIQFEDNLKTILENELNEIHLKYKKEKAGLEAVIISFQDSIQDYEIKLEGFIQELMRTDGCNNKNFLDLPEFQELKDTLTTLKKMDFSKNNKEAIEALKSIYETERELFKSRIEELEFALKKSFGQKKLNLNDKSIYRNISQEGQMLSHEEIEEIYKIGDYYKSLYEKTSKELMIKSKELYERIQENEETHKNYKKLFNSLSFKPFKLTQAETSKDSNNIPSVKYQKKYYKVYFSKDVKKKHKNFDEGIMIVALSSLILMNSEGNKIYECNKPKFIDELIGNEEPFAVSHAYFIEIDQEISEDLFTSGKAFLSAMPEKSEIDKIKMKSVKKFKNTTNANEYIVPEDCHTIYEGDKEIGLFPIYIEKFLCNTMRPHQIDGVKFMLECITGLKGKTINGCILADSMGLGKTLQSISLIWTLLRQNPYNPKSPFLKKVIIIAPVSLIKNWEREIDKWLGNSRLIPLAAIGTREEVLKTVNRFSDSLYRCLIISYESFRINVNVLKGKCDLLILDEGHRLKNMNIKTFTCFNTIDCNRRIILTGTPLQNSLDEFYSCISFVNPGIFPNLNTFRKVFSNPIMESFKKNADEEKIKIAKERSKELSKIISQIILRRQPNILQKHLPPKHEFYVFLKLSEKQTQIYQKSIKNRNFMNSKSTEILSFVQALRKTLNHPSILFKGDSELSDSMRSYVDVDVKEKESVWESSFKFKFLFDVLNKIKELKDLSEKIIIVSYFTQTLDMVGILCEELKFKIVRLDGKVQACKRQSLVDKFNNPHSGIQIFLLCGKAGGTGLNLIGGNRMILLDVDWNPSNDLQVMGRVWRDGQTKPVYIYRLFSSGTLEEKILQRQKIKENLSDNIVDEKRDYIETMDEDISKLLDYNPHFKCQSFPEEENELEELLELSPDFLEEMKEYITFIKEKRNAEVDLNNSNIKSENIFNAENIFISSDDEKQKKTDINCQNNSEEKIDEDQNNDEKEENNSETDENDNKDNNEKEDCDREGEAKTGNEVDDTKKAFEEIHIKNIVDIDDSNELKNKKPDVPTEENSEQNEKEEAELVSEKTTEKTSKKRKFNQSSDLVLKKLKGQLFNK